MTLLQKALIWFGPETEKLTRPERGFPPVISEGRILEYYLRRFPWEKE